MAEFHTQSQRPMLRPTGVFFRLIPFLIAAAAVGWLLVAPSGAAMYQWTMPDGSIGLTDDPGRIPEQYRASATPYRGPMSELTTTPAPSAAPPGSKTPAARAGETDQNGHNETWWRARTEALQEQRTTTLKERETTEQQINELHYFGRETVAELQEKQALRQHMAELTTQLTEIDRQTSDLSEEARKAGAPPGWLRR